MVPGTRNDFPEATIRSGDPDRSRLLRKQDISTRTFEPPTARNRKKWPPAPSVEDESTSLSREHSPTLPELAEGEAQMKGSVDQMPILFEVGKEHENCPTTSIGSRKKKGSQQRWSSDDSIGPDTPNDSSASDSNDARQRKPPKHHEASLASSIKTILEDQRHPDGQNRSRTIRLPERILPTATSPRASTFQYQSSTVRNIQTMQEPNRLYPGTLEELKTHQGEREEFGYAERHRTMSGSNNAADHRPANIRHMSAMGYSGESQTPSFARDHPGLYPSSDGRTRNVPPLFRQPRDKDHDAIIDSSDSDVSPDEMYGRSSRQRRTFPQSQQRSSFAYEQPPPKEPIKQSSQPSTSERRSGRAPIPSALHTHRRQDSHGTANKRSPIISPDNSPYPSPPPSPRSTSRPSSREGSRPFIYPAVYNKAPPKRSSRPSSPVRVAPNTETFATSNLRYSSRPSSPVLEPSKESSDHNLLPKAEINVGIRDALKPETAGSRDPSPIQIPRSPASPRPNVRVESQYPERLPASNIPARSNLEARQPLLSGDGSFQTFIASPAAAISSIHRNPSNSWRPDSSSHAPAIPSKTMKPPKARAQLIPCPRPGFTTKYNDWWTLPQISDLDICPDCKQSLQDNGLEAKFVRSQARPPGTRTRCDMNVSWVRIAFILVLSGREKLEVLKYLMDVLATEDECPQDKPGIGRKWYRVYDDEADKHVSGFSVCPACVESIRVLFPNLKGTFKSYTSSSQDPKICDLSAYVPRFARYVDLLDNISTRAKLYRESPDTKMFIRTTRDFVGIPPCTQDNQFRGRAWHFTPHIPDFTVCGECFMEVVRPAQRAGFDVAEQISRKILLPRDVDKALSCQLYSPRMRAIFEESCRNQNMGSLREHAMIRVAKERELQHRFSLAQTLPEEQREETMEILIAEWKRWQ